MAEGSTKDADDEIVMQCVACEYHVHFYKKPIHGFVATTKPPTGASEGSGTTGTGTTGTGTTGTLKVYLTCDNPITPHTNAYTVRL